ncbi:hypothetical protein ScalyP_jg8193 [Parmales sp. scaly parma]|nr:hypothetical protein ScalyP_jg8193 [Parmales sp. scaly parma]
MSDATTAEGGTEETPEEEIARLEKELQEFEAEANEAILAPASSSSSTESATKADDAGDAADAEKKELNSIYVGQVDYEATPESLVQFFSSCGAAERVTIICDKQTGRPKGFAYVEFDSVAAVDLAVKLDGKEGASYHPYY